MKILIIGGYGTFGGRLAELLMDTGGLEILIAGRNLDRAQAFCDGLIGAARARPVQVSRDGIGAALATHRPDLVVDASGPFQTYGADPYGVVRACIGAGVNYLDLADGSDFVFGISDLDEAARKAGVFALAGASSFPVLTAAVLRRMSQDIDIRTVTGGIAPSPHAIMGPNVMRAVLSYAGRPVKLVRDGQPGAGRGLADTCRFTVSPPGQMPLPPLIFGLVDVPDLQVLPRSLPGLQSLWMGAGPSPVWIHRCLIGLARLRARIPALNYVPLAGLFRTVLRVLKYGEHRGGMFVRAEGLRNGLGAAREWHLLAEGDDGPYIPSMTAEGVVRRILAGDPPAPGARPATDCLELDDYDRLFAGRRISYGWRGRVDGDAPLYARMLEGALANLSPMVRALHDDRETARWTGQATVSGGSTLFARLIARLFGFPSAADTIPVTVELGRSQNGVEVWTRTFGGKRFHSSQRAGTGRMERLIEERFGPFRFGLAVLVCGDRLELICRKMSVLGVPVPGALIPGGHAFEAEEDGNFRFDVRIALPLVGRIVHYQGRLERAETP
ncbi:SDR family NAD(P)-dependent oxidoreductase [Loktanella sp. IMCC34160]|uniref:SDR family oxidoreductase n=1 Tax=Loktanella sp. IMCC34160 TaxID=2510646 RepID=UPI00101DC07E|nr:SDR family oxidoreductase [Loktanella sp. IMCC34160]RYG92136.1 SDR family NAD(P)-dependent oxidoreductase [Loktanella sp. IMCC34160]